jgi:DNA invertase Pin-like site-specific DNA recombinase
MKTVFYCRVSTVDQTLEHQRTQAHQVGFKPASASWYFSSRGAASGLKFTTRPPARSVLKVLSSNLSCWGQSRPQLSAKDGFFGV